MSVNSVSILAFLADINTQHSEMKRMLSNLSTLDASDNNSKRFLDSLNAMMDYVSLHFKTEEELMESLDYLHVARHKKEHTTFKNEIVRFCKEFVKDEFNDFDKVVDFIEQWLEEHDVAEDIELVTFFTRAIR